MRKWIFHELNSTQNQNSLQLDVLCLCISLTNATLAFPHLALVLPTLHFKLSVKHSLWCCWKILFKSCHHWEVKFLLPPQINSFHPPYLEIKILDQGWSWLLASCHPHLPSKAALNFFFEKQKIIYILIIIGHSSTRSTTGDLHRCSASKTAHQ